VAGSGEPVAGVGSRPEPALSRQQPVVKLRLHSTGDASRLAALLLARILPDILGRRALRSGRLARLGATPGFTTGC